MSVSVGGASSGVFRGLKLVKIVRMVRLLRLFRVLKIARVRVLAEEFMEVSSQPAHQRAGFGSTVGSRVLGYISVCSETSSTSCS